ncbi:RNA 3'-terminal phosphate cyclase [Candidatus Woesearchaeota archaeon]|nr:RNA 3'-terminal phosphate cyclase [Candidatus Woesearchaeota archaeon]
MLHIDGSYHEGGGQIVRTALGLSTLLQKPFSVDRIRLGRPQPGLKNQHLHCILALKELCNAEAIGAKVGSTTLEYIPHKIAAKNVTIDIGTAGSITLLMQALWLPLIFGNNKTKKTITVIGGTDTEWAMPANYLNEIFVPQLQKYAEINVKLEKRGYYPKGGGKMTFTIKPKFSLETIKDAPQIMLMEQGKLLQIKGVSHASTDLEATQVAERQAQAAETILKRFNCPVQIAKEYQQTLSTGSGITVWAIFANNKGEVDTLNPVKLGADCLGEKGVRAEVVGTNAAERLVAEIQSKAACDSHLADNLLPFMALTGGRLRTSKVTDHATTNMYTIEKFLPARFSIEGNVISCLKYDEEKI